MAYNKELAERVKTKLKGISGVVEKEKMGGLTFMKDRKLYARIQDNDLMVRCDKNVTEELLKKEGARRFEMKGKTNMKDWLLIGSEGLKSQEGFDYWMGITHDFNCK
ncbi:TfoX/Sxy family protein [Fulvivirga sp. M361]|uniref:TfoX/Sxy family protein n=1 Tax=Fulvivirga sp. M361 TaxID=2594266 RepID=UPI00117B1C93|nr:TfoX/Sxy family protein [Fulvivirga sp. M361]TRX48599.1 TfoX/Sxy family protein [Fulvivirga sp. M361]